MNERIRELYEQARIHAKSIDADIDPKGWMDEYHRKFAQLIVQECMQLNRDILCEDDPNYLDQIYREHFGVEK